MTGVEHSILIYDGDCGFCTAAAMWVSASWRSAARAVPFQALGSEDLAGFGLTPDDVRKTAWWVDSSGRRDGGHRAVGRALLECRGWRRVLGRAVLLPALSVISRSGYALVSRYRHMLPGGASACGSG